MEDKDIYMEFDQEYGAEKNMRVLKQELGNGDRRRIGGITIEVQVSDQKLLKVT